MSKNVNRHGLEVLDPDGQHRRRPKRNHDIGMLLAYNTLMTSRAMQHVWNHSSSTDEEQHSNKPTQRKIKNKPCHNNFDHTSPHS
jgi:hypothetical protein